MVWEGVRVCVFGRNKRSVHYFGMSPYQFILCYTSACMHMYTHVRTHSCTHTHTHAHTHALTNTHTHTQRHTNTDTYAHTHTRARMHARTHIHTHTHTHILIPFKDCKPSGLKVDFALLYCLCCPLWKLRCPAWGFEPVPQPLVPYSKAPNTDRVQRSIVRICFTLLRLPVMLFLI